MVDLEADRPLLLQQYAVRQRVDDHLQIGSPLSRMQERGYSRFPSAVADGSLPQAESLRIGAVEVRALRQIQCARGFQKTGHERIDLWNVADGHGPTDLMVGTVRKCRVVLRS